MPHCYKTQLEKLIVGILVWRSPAMGILKSQIAPPREEDGGCCGGEHGRGARGPWGRHCRGGRRSHHRLHRQRPRRRGLRLRLPLQPRHLRHPRGTPCRRGLRHHCLKVLLSIRPTLVCHPHSEIQTIAVLGVSHDYIFVPMPRGDICSLQ
jgi:hypothetical protein